MLRQGRTLILNVLLLFLIGLMPPQPNAHQTETYPDHSAVVETIMAAHQDGSATTGQGGWVFRIKHDSGILPEAAREALPRAHGGFAIDTRDGRGEVYFALPGAGIIRLNAALSSATLLPTAPAMKAANLHNCTFWVDNRGRARLVFPANNAGKVFTTDLEGNLLHTLDAPTAETRFDAPWVEAYFGEGGRFAPTDVAYLNPLYYVTTGYSPLDAILTAQVKSPPLAAQWHDLAFSRKGEQAGQLQTGHGITVAPDGTRLDVADRPVAQIERFTRFGHYRSTINLPEGAFPCDIAYLDDLAVVPCLHGKNREAGAPIYLLQDGKVISTIRPKADLGLETFQHIHNAVIKRHKGRLLIAVQSWNPGDFVVLEQVQ